VSVFFVEFNPIALHYLKQADVPELQSLPEEFYLV
jgi:hypothetical protein